MQPLSRQLSVPSFTMALILVGLVSTAGCGPERIRDATDDGGLGRSGPFAIDRETRHVRVRIDESVRTEIYLPIIGEETTVDNAPLAVVVQGGLVPAARYRWLALHLASKGMVVAMPDHPLDLAFFGQPNPIDVARALRAASDDTTDTLFGRISPQAGLIVGHSLGGVVSAKGWTFAPTAFSHLAMFAGIPDPADVDTIADRPGGEVLSIVGSVDARIGPDAVAEGAEPFGDRVTIAVVDGVNHYQFTDDASEDELATDGEPTVSTEDGRERALYVLDAFIADLVPSLNADGVLVAPRTWPAGVSPYVPAAQGGAE